MLPFGSAFDEQDIERRRGDQPGPDAINAVIANGIELGEARPADQPLQPLAALLGIDAGADGRSTAGGPAAAGGDIDVERRLQEMFKLQLLVPGFAHTRQGLTAGKRQKLAPDGRACRPAAIVDR